MKITRDEIKRGLSRLGLKKGSIVIVHSALSSLGEVEGGADAVIDALLEAVGDEGTVMMPAFSPVEVFDVDQTPSGLGEITERFRRRPGVLRSLHPTHSVCVQGARAEELIKDHVRARSGCGEGTPYSRLIEEGGFVLLLGVDQDRNTTLHTLEAFTARPYLSRRTARFRDPASGEIKEVELERHPGPHRDFIGLDRRFREAGVMKIGKIGGAVCRLIDARGLERVVREEIGRDPAAVLCRNPHCWDCVRQRQKLGTPSLEKEDFILSALADEISPDLGTALAVLRREGIGHLELRTVKGKRFFELTDRRLKKIKEEIAREGMKISGLNFTDPAEKTGRGKDDLPTFRRALACARLLEVKRLIVSAPPRPGRAGKETGQGKALDYFAGRVCLAEAEGIGLLVENRPGTFCDTSAACEEAIWAVGSPGLRLAFNPAHFARMNERPFLGIKPRIRKLAAQLYLCDALFDNDLCQPVGFGNGEVKELVSILRCRSFSGYFTLKIGFGRGEVNFVKALRAFWDLLETM